jgi:alkylation response protein AidB-like acyl-CoA dehydrogenase
MRFAFSEDQLLFSGVLRELLEKECTAGDVRAEWASADGRSRSRWANLAEIGAVGLTVPEQYGGMGAEETSLVTVLEECGRACLPEPLLETTAVAVPLIRDRAPEQLRQRWLPRVASGESVVTVGLEAVPLVADAHWADLLVLQRGDELHAVERHRVGLEPQSSIDGARRLFNVAWEPTPDTLMVKGVEARLAVSEAFDRAAAAVAAELIGVGQQMVDLATAYARERHQFGQPIGTFQAVKHLLANALLRLEFARPVVYRAAWSLARGGEDRSRDASMAKAYASEAALYAARAALQTHGAIGYTWEHDLHLWMKRAWALAASWGDAAWHRERVAQAVLDQAPGSSPRR